MSIEKFFFTRLYILEIESLIRKKRFCNFNILSIEFCKVIYSSIFIVVEKEIISEKSLVLISRIILKIFLTFLIR